MGKNLPLFSLPFVLGVLLHTFIPAQCQASDSFTKSVMPFADIAFQQTLPAEDRAYLGLEETAAFRLSDIKTELLLVEFLNRYCFGCQALAPVMNDALAQVAKDASLKDRVRALGIAVGNNEREAGKFRSEKSVSFPIVPDAKFKIYEELGFVGRTPLTVLVRKGKDGALIAVGLRRGLVDDHNAILKEIRAALALDWEGVAAMAKGSPARPKTGRPKLPISEAELTQKIEAAMKALGDELSGFRKVPLYDGVDAYEATVTADGVKKKVFARRVGRNSICDVCHDIHFFYVLDPTGKILDVVPILLTKAGNRKFNKRDVAKLKKRVVGKNVGDALDFDPEVDAITRATITTAVIFDALRRGQKVLGELKK